MKRWARTTGWIVFWATLATALLLGAVLAWLLSEVLPPGTVVTIDDERFVVHGLTHFGHWFAAGIGVLIAAMVLVVVVPLIVVLAIVVPAAVGGISLALGLGVIALVLWPLYLLGRWLWKTLGKPTTMRA